MNTQTTSCQLCHPKSGQPKMRSKESYKPGFTLVEIMLVVAIIGLLAVLAIPNFLRARSTAQKNACITNLRQIDSGKQQWAIENKKQATETPTSDDVARYIKNGKFPACPAGGTYTVNAANTDPTCSESASGHVLAVP
jgi:prepilin-type N-terminal cleavage/methylation domain-containing protein